MEDRKKPLGTYRDKRAPGVTNEPFGDEQPAGGGSKTETGAFVIHLHDATRRHYDVRLEVGGVLLSFAVPKGPSLDPTEKLLAVRTEEHPIEYLDFEDIIPDGQYGAGPMIVWDRGVVNYIEGPAEDELAQGKLHIELRGMKVRGIWAFVRLAKGEKGNEYLFFKKQDAFASPGRKIVDEMPRSLLSGLTIEELEKRDEIAAVHNRFAITIGAQKNEKLIEELLKDAESPLVTPLSKELEWTPRIYDADLDGIRILAIRDGDVITLRSWSGGSTSGAVERIEAFYPDVVRALRALPVSKIALDGELVAFDPTGRPNMNLLAQRVAKIAKGDVHRAITTQPVVLVCKDILALNDLDTRAVKLEDRRHLLTEMLGESVGFLRAASPLEGDEARVVATCAELGIGSLVAKAKGSAYSNTAIGGKKDGKKHSPWTHIPTGLGPRLRAVVDHQADDVRISLRRVPITNREKIYFPPNPDGIDALHQGAFTKGDLVDYYTAVADTVLPYLKDRPVILVRYPDGIDGKSFYQWNVPVGMPPWVRTMTMHEIDDFRAVVSGPSSPLSPRSHSGGRPSSSSAHGGVKTPKRVFLVDDSSTLVYIANLGCIPLHVLASRAPDLTRADFLTIDFDVKQSELRHSITLAITLHEILEQIGLPSFPKTSGQTGLHVLIPLGLGQSFDTARALADLLGRLLVQRHPNIATMDRVVNRRGDKVYVDTGQTGTSRAIVSPYSVRAVKGATVSTPLTWDEVTPDLNPRLFTIKTVPARIAKRGDLLKGLLGGAPNIGRAVGKLADLVTP